MVSKPPAAGQRRASIPQARPEIALLLWGGRRRENEVQGRKRRRKYPEDTWYAWLNDSWTRIPAEKIVKDHAPNGEPYLFVLAGTIQCFVRPKGGTLRARGQRMPRLLVAQG